MMKLPLNKEEILPLIPQRKPFVMVDSLIEYSETITKSRFEILNDGLLIEDNQLTEAGLTENIAQTGALSSGYSSLIKKEKPPVGFIGSIKDLKIYFLPNVGSILETSVEFTHQIGNVSVIIGRCEVDGKLAAECEMKIFLQE